MAHRQKRRRIERDETLESNKRSGDDLSLDREQSTSISDLGALIHSLSDKMDERMGKLEKGLGKVEKRLGKVEKRLGKRMGKLEKRVGKLEKKYGRIERESRNMRGKLNNIWETSPLALLRAVNPSVIDEEIHKEDAILSGGIATWTKILFKGKLFVVGSKHCALFYRTNHCNINFVSLPRTVLRANVKQIYFSGELDSTLVKDDCIVVEVEDEPLGLSSNLASEHVNASIQGNVDFVFGASLSGPVLGKSACWSEDGHVVFVEDQGESGNSGTLMFSQEKQPDGVDSFPMIGTYYGVDKARRGLRCRGMIAPLPENIFGNTNCLEKVEFPTLETLNVYDGKSRKNCKLSQPVGTPYVVLVDGGIEYPGILVGGGEFDYCGARVVGACRSK